MKNNEWMEIAKLVASDGNADDYFGYSVSISQNYALIGAQNYALIGAYKDDDKGTDSGAAYIFEMKNNEWIEPWDGKAYIFEMENNEWNQTAKLVAGDGNAHD
eukprot:92834_1